MRIISLRQFRTGITAIAEPVQVALQYYAGGRGEIRILGTWTPAAESLGAAVVRIAGREVKPEIHEVLAGPFEEE